MSELAAETVETTAPVEQPAESTPAETPVVETEQESTEQVAQETTGDPSAPPKGVEKRIGELTRNWRETERDRDYWRQLAMQQTQQPAQQQQQPEVVQPVTVAPVPPDKYDFASDDEYRAAVQKYQTDNERYIDYRAEQLAQKQVQQTRQQQQEQQIQEKVTTLKTKLQAGHEKYEDFGLVTGDTTLPWTPDMTEALVALDNTADVAYMVSKDRDLVTRISQMSPLQQAMELKALDLQIGARQKTTTNAPEPITPVKPTGTPITDPDRLPMDVWVKLREEGKI